ncbi:MAG: hypothetical protein IPH28_05715 [Cytophagaceae bacterium]|nr:hypothetical protein [Cytophagaceae bacterium]
MKKVLYIIAVIAIATACFKNATNRMPDEIDFSKLPYKTLSEYGFFKGEMNHLAENEGVVPYEPISPLFTDYAFKKRFVFMPKNTQASIPDDPDAMLDFPENTILIKNFYYPSDFRKPEGEKQIVETRILLKRKGKWEAYPYLWNDQQTEANLKNTGAKVDVKYINQHGENVAIKYAMPQKNQCKSCHYRNNTFSPIGPKAKQLNFEISYADGKANQLSKWKALGILKSEKDIASIKTLVNPMDETKPINDRARAYLDANCGHCHSGYGPAASSGLYLNFEETRQFHIGVKKSPVAAGIGAGTFNYDVNPGHGMESIMTFRMNSTHPGIMMPEIGRVTIHKEGVDLIAKWIDGLE